MPGSARLNRSMDAEVCCQSTSGKHSCGALDLLPRPNNRFSTLTTSSGEKSVWPEAPDAGNAWWNQFAIRQRRQYKSVSVGHLCRDCPSKRLNASGSLLWRYRVNRKTGPLPSFEVAARSVNLSKPTAFQLTCHTVVGLFTASSTIGHKRAVLRQSFGSFLQGFYGDMNGSGHLVRMAGQRSAAPCIGSHRLRSAGLEFCFWAS